MVFVLTQKESASPLASKAGEGDDSRPDSGLESKVLYEIKDVLSFGEVKNYKGFSRYIISNNVRCFLLYLLFNGNLVLNSRINQLYIWYSTLLELKKLNVLKNFGIQGIPDINLISKKPSIRDGWLSGFTDAEGCFSVSIYKGKNGKEYCRCRYILDQKGEQELLLYIRSLFCSGSTGSVYLRSKTYDVFRLTISVNEPNKRNFDLIIKYFQNYTLKTTKCLNFEMWCKVIKLIISKKHNTFDGLKEVRRLRTEMNKYVINNKSIGSSKYS